jgi:hypothetical protein
MTLDKGFFNMNKISKFMDAVPEIKDELPNPFDWGELDQPVELYALINGKLSKVRGMPELPQGTTFSFEYNCKLDQKEKSSNFLFIDNKDMELFAVF